LGTVGIVVGSFLLYLLAYHTYGRYVSRRVFGVDPGRVTPAHEREDGVDFVPSKRDLVFGHHFTSIAGTGPIVGPAIAVVWGWVPALVWVLLGSIFMGAVHDLGSLVISMRHRGRTIADLAGDVVNPRVRALFMVVCIVGIWIVLAIFGLVIATIFRLYPSSVVPVWSQIPIAIGLGWWVRRGGSLTLGSVVAVILMYGSITWSASLNWDEIAIIPEWLGERVSAVAVWTLLLMVYVWVASVLPVQVLLQPRDYINAWQLVVAMALLILGVLAARPDFVADAVQLSPAPAANGARPPPIFPFLFVTVACGAVSGFHCLVSSGCSSRQLSSEADAQYVGFGAMLTEGFLAVLVIVACAAGIGLGTGDGLIGREAWLHHYGQWGGDAGMGAVLAPFVSGSANMMERLGLSHSLCVGIMGVFVASFAATTLDSAARLQRYLISELAGSRRPPEEGLCRQCGYKLDQDRGTACPECGPDAPASWGGSWRWFFTNRYAATSVTVVTAIGLALSDAVHVMWSKGMPPSQGPRGWHSIGNLHWMNNLENAGLGGLVLWPVFGATNQLLAGLALLVVTVWLVRTGRPCWVTVIPMVFMIAVSLYSIALLAAGFAEDRSLLLLMVSSLMVVAQLWAVAEAAALVWRSRKQQAPA
jgi:carbon starvation protein